MSVAQAADPQDTMSQAESEIVSMGFSLEVARKALK
jgi:hypothetical protein